MSAPDDKDRTIKLGLIAWFLLTMICGALFGIGDQLRHINKTLTMANCLTEAAHGIICSEAKPGK